MPDTPAAEAVSCRLHGEVLLVTIANPLVNALGADVRRGLLAASAPD